MADLHYFPLMVSDWLASETTTTMTLEQEGAFLRLLCHAWQSKNDVPCSLPADDSALAELSKLRGRWKKAGALIVAQFKPVEGSPDRIRNRKQWAVYQVSLAKHKKRVEAGKKGRNTRTLLEQSDSDAEAMLENSSQQNGSNHNHSHNQRTTKTLLPPRELPEEFHRDYEKLLAKVPDAEAWAAEIRVASEGLHGKTLSPTQIGQAIRDYLANGATPNLRHFRGYLRGTNGKGKTQQQRNAEVLDQYLEEKNG